MTNAQCNHTQPHYFITIIKALIGRPFEHWDECSKVLNENGSSAVCVSPENWGKETIAQKIVFKNQNVLMTQSWFCNVQKTEMKQLSNMFSVLLLSKRSWLLSPSCRDETDRTSLTGCVDVSLRCCPDSPLFQDVFCNRPATVTAKYTMGSHAHV